MATLTSQNGWTVLEDPPPIAELVPGILRLRVRPGDVETVLGYVARRFHAEVERLDLVVTEDPGFDDWGWNFRLVRDSTTNYSNHASATAIDLNATRHPRGVTGTYSSAQRAAVRRILAVLKDEPTGDVVVRWGEDYTTTIDGMHFEINAGAAAVSRVADKIRALEAPPPPEDPMPALPALVKNSTAAGTPVYFVTDVGKRRCVSQAVIDALRADFDLPDVHLVSSTSLSLFPTLPLDGNNNASDPATSALAAVSAVATQVAGVAAQLQQLAVAESDNATATQLAQSSAQLAAAVQALGVVVGDDATQSSVDELQDLVQEVHDAVVPPPAP